MCIPNWPKFNRDEKNDDSGKKIYPSSWMKDKHGVRFFLSEQRVKISLRFEERFLFLLVYFLSFYFMNVSSTIKKTEI